MKKLMLAFVVSLLLIACGDDSGSFTPSGDNETTTEDVSFAPEDNGNNGLEYFEITRINVEPLRINIATDGTEGNGRSSSLSISDNQYVAFTSYASNLVYGDTNGMPDVFVRDMKIGITTRISVATDGTEGNGFSWSPFISSDGRYVAFHSFASNLVTHNTGSSGNIFVHDTQNAITTHASLAIDGTEGNGNSKAASISDNGRYVAFQSAASNLVFGDRNSWDDIFVHDMQTGETTRVSLASDGTEGDSKSQDPSISGDGRYVVFWSHSTNLVDGDNNKIPDIFLHDTKTRLTTRINVASDGSESNGRSSGFSISDDGRYLAFQSVATNLVDGDTNRVQDIFLHDTKIRLTIRISIAFNGAEANSFSFGSTISGDGKYVTFNSDASNLVADDTNNEPDVFRVLNPLFVGVE